VPRICKVLKNAFDLAEEEKEIEQKLVKASNVLYQEKINFLDGFTNFHNHLKDKNIKNCIASNAYDETMKIISKKLNFSSFFGHHVYTISSVDNKPKPHPDIFLHAAKQLDVPKENCVVFEDAAEGILAAKRAGIKCVGIDNKTNSSHIKDADLIIDGYQDLTIEKIEEKLFS